MEGKTIDSGGKKDDPPDSGSGRAGAAGHAPRLQRLLAAPNGASRLS